MIAIAEKAGSRQELRAHPRHLDHLAVLKVDRALMCWVGCGKCGDQFQVLPVEERERLHLVL
ncbi:MAG: hypothetical protein NW700_13020 [Nitrospiraceae bacterium]